MTLTLRPGYIPKTALATALATAKATRQDVTLFKDGKTLAIVQPDGTITYFDEGFRKACA